MNSIPAQPTPAVEEWRLGSWSCGTLMSPEEFDAIDYEDCESGFRYQLINGVVIVTPIQGEWQADPNEELGTLLRNYQKRHPQGGVIDKTLPERHVFVGLNRRQADRVIWTGLGRRPMPKVDVPTIVIEFVSTGRRNWIRDYVDKRDEYLNFGVKEYRVINRFQREMTVFTPGSDRFEERVVASSEIYKSPLLPGFELPLAEILSIANQWDQE